MTAQRIAQLERAAAPRAVILRWLEEIHAFATLPHYVQWLHGQPPARWPFALLPKQAAAHVRRAMRGVPELEIVRAIGASVTETAFLVELVLLLNAVTDDRQRETALRCRLRVAEMGVLEVEQSAPDTRGPHATEDGASIAERVEAWRRAVSADAKEVACAEQARRLLEQRYLDGRSALFPRAAEKWEVTRDAVIENAHLAADVLGPAEVTHDDGADDAAAMAQASHLAEMARAAALGLMGDSSGARAVTARRLRKASRVPMQ